MDILPFLYYDKLIDNTFSEFADLLFLIRRIEEGIKRERIMKIEAKTLGKERNVFDEHDGR